MVIQNEHNIGDFVYLKTDVYQIKRLVTAIVIHMYGLVYELSIGEETSYNEAFEISNTRDIELLEENL